jgi:hypothetical protein
MLYTDVMYLKRVTYRLQKFKVKKDTGNTFLANCKCPYCEQDKEGRKARGYFIAKGDKLFFYCHNCHASEHFSKFLKGFDYPLWSEYKLSVLKDRNGGFNLAEKYPAIPQEPVEKYVPDIFHGLTAILDLPEDHPARKIIENRKIPAKFLAEMFYIPRFIEWTKGHTDKFKSVMNDNHPRFVIPWYDEDGAIIGYQARAFGPEMPKYYSIMLDESKPKIFGLDRVDLDRKVYCVEGPIDSMFLDNCVAVGDAALWKFSADDVTYIPDFERRNPDILKVYKTLINMGKNVCMLPETWPYKDLNDAIRGGLTSDQLKLAIDTHTYSGLEAKAKFNEWKKIGV